MTDAALAPAATGEVAVQITGMNKWYGTFHVLRDIDLTVYRGELHALMYGDRPVASATLKAEISRLRTVLGGGIASRPYRTTVPVRCDAVDVLVRLGRLLELHRLAAKEGDFLLLLDEKSKGVFEDAANGAATERGGNVLTIHEETVDFPLLGAGGKSVGLNSKF